MMIFVEAEEKWSLAKGKRGYHFTEHRRKLSHPGNGHTKSPSAGGRPCPIRFIHKLWQPKWPTLRKHPSSEAVIARARLEIYEASQLYRYGAEARLQYTVTRQK